LAPALAAAQKSGNEYTVTGFLSPVFQRAPTAAFAMTQSFSRAGSSTRWESTS
jgi:hypothetical protein